MIIVLASVVFFLGSVLDTVSSLGYKERNPVNRGKDGYFALGRAVIITFAGYFLALLAAYTISTPERMSIIIALGGVAAFAMGTKNLYITDRLGYKPSMRDTLVQLVSELPENAVIYRPLDGKSEGYTTKEVTDEIDSGTDLGRQYGTDLLRVARSMLAGAARRKE